MKRPFLMKYDDPKFEETGLKVVKRNIKKDSTYQLHWHDYFELEIIMEGEAEHVYNNTTTKAQPGNAYILSYQDCHYFKLKSDILLYNIRFSEKYIDQNLVSILYAGINKCNCLFDKDELKMISSIADELYNECSSDREYKQHLSSSLLTNIIIKLLRKSETTFEVSSSALIQKSISYIYENFQNNITLSSMAQSLSVSVNYLGGLFKKDMGVPFNTYLNMIRLKHACTLLTVSDNSIKEIAFLCGYNSIEYFLQVFKKNLCTTPTKYRQIEKKKKINTTM